MHRFLAAAVFLLLVAPVGADEAGDAPKGKANEKKAEQKQAEARKLGRGVFMQSVRWIQGAGPKMPAVTRAHLLFKDVQIHDEDPKGRRHEGHLELWFEAPGRFRETWRKDSRDERPMVKVLDGGKAWIKTPTQPDFRRQHGAGGSGAGTEAIAQLQRDMQQIADLARFLSPVSLDGKGVIWALEGEQRLAPPLAPKDAGAFTRVRRTAPGEPDMLFLFASVPAEAGAAGGRYPYAVGIQGDKAKGQRQEWFVLDRWQRQAGGHARPRRIRGFAPSGKGGLYRFILLFPELVELNPKLPPNVFRGQPLK